MPIYEFTCQSCDTEFEMMRSFSDTSIPTCPKCKGQNVVRMLSRPAIHFKGSGWYITDSKNASKNGTNSTKPESETDSSSASDTKSESKDSTSTDSSASESKPTESKAPEAKSSETKKNDAKPSESKPSETKAPVKS